MADAVEDTYDAEVASSSHEAQKNFFPWFDGQISFVPRTDVVEDSRGVKITADLPGVTDSLKVEVKAKMIVISGERLDKDKQNVRIISAERVFGKFQRSFPIPSYCAASRTQARLSGGVLDIVIPKKPNTGENRRDIQIVKAKM
eukprot:Filipodium_phascolosomae@DN683_c0_g1_i1.p1